MLGLIFQIYCFCMTFHIFPCIVILRFDNSKNIYRSSLNLFYQQDLALIYVDHKFYFFLNSWLGYPFCAMFILNSLYYYFLVISFNQYKEQTLCLTSFSKFWLTPAFTCAVAIGNLWSRCKYFDSLSLSWF